MENKNLNELDNKPEDNMVETTKYSREEKISNYYKNQSKGSIAVGILLIASLVVCFFLSFIFGTPLIFVVYFALVFVGGICWSYISSKKSKGKKDILLKNKNELIKVTTNVVFVKLVASASIGNKSISKYSVMVEVDGVKMESETLRQYIKGDVIDIYIHPKYKGVFLFADEVEN